MGKTLTTPLWPSGDRVAEFGVSEEEMVKIVTDRNCTLYRLCFQRCL